MKKGIRNFCNGDASTSTLNQQHDSAAPCPVPNSDGNSAEKSISSSITAPTLEEMILKLEIEEENARRAKITRNRKACLSSNSSDILLSARNALNQYPRFSLDGKDAMYRSSFRNSDDIIKPARKSVCCDYGHVNDIRSGSRLLMQRPNGHRHRDYLEYSSSSTLVPLITRTTLAGERVEWCKPGVVAKLMGLDAMPVPAGVPVKLNTKEKLSSILKTHTLRRKAQMHQIDHTTAACPSTHPHFL